MLRTLPLMAALAATPALADEFPVRLADGDTWTIQAEHSRTVVGDKPQAWALTTVKRLTWRAGAKGGPATLTVTPVSATPGAGSPAELAAARSLAIPATIVVSDSLEPQAVVNRDEVRAAFSKLIPQAANAPDKVIEASALAMIASEVGQAARLQGLSLQPGQTMSVAGEAPSPFGVSIPTTETVQLVSVDAASHRAVVIWTQRPDPKAFKAAVTKMIEEMVGSDGDPARAARQRAALEKISITGESRCRDEIDTRTGLAARAECSLAQTVSDGDKTQSSTDRWIITQSSPEKS